MIRGQQAPPLFGPSPLWVVATFANLSLRWAFVVVHGALYDTTAQTRMWANAQRDGCPAEYRWRLLFNAAKFAWRPVLECRGVTLPRRETRWNVLGCPKLANRSQPLVGRSSPYYQGMWTSYCCLTSFFPIVDTCLSCEDSARQSCAMVPRWRIFGIFCVLYFQWAACSTFQTCIQNSHWRPHHVWKYGRLPICDGWD